MTPEKWEGPLNGAGGFKDAGAGAVTACSGEELITVRALLDCAVTGGSTQTANGKIIGIGRSARRR